MSSTKQLGNPLKIALRNRLKSEILPSITAESRERQSRAVTEKILGSSAFRNADSISVYLSTPKELDTRPVLEEMFRLEKKVFVPTYNGNDMEMLRLRDMADFMDLPTTSWHIKQPEFNSNRDNALLNGHGIDLFLMPGVGFTLSGGRLGHGRGYYDRYLDRHRATYPHKKVVVMGLAFREQILKDEDLPMDKHDVRMHTVLTE